MSGSCHGLQKLVNVCTAYGLEWDLKFNPSKSQVAVFGGPVRNSCQIFLGTSEIGWCKRVKYLGCYFDCRTADIDVSSCLSKFYSSFNSILSVQTEVLLGLRETG